MKPSIITPMRVPQPDPNPTPARPFTVGAVRFLNTQPLVRGLTEDASVRIAYDVPSALLPRLVAGELDVALLPVAEWLAAPIRLVRVGDAIIGAEDRSLTVKLFTRRPPTELTEVALDPDSRSSVALFKLLCRHVWHCAPRLVPLSLSPRDWPRHEACLLIGDKVISEAFTLRTQCCGAERFAEHDLASEWRAWTGRPFVFATWAARADTSPWQRAAWAGRLAAARDRGLRELDAIIGAEAAPRGWPLDLARDYLADHLSFCLTPAHRRGLALFLRLLRQERDEHET